MDKTKTSQGAHAGAFSTRNRRLFFRLALFLTLGLAGLQSTAAAQSCVQQCQQQYQSCVRDGHGLICDDAYDGCLASCLGRSRRAASGLNLSGVNNTWHFMSLWEGRFFAPRNGAEAGNGFGVLRSGVALNGVQASP